MSDTYSNSQIPPESLAPGPSSATNTGGTDALTLGDPNISAVVEPKQGQPDLMKLLGPTLQPPDQGLVDQFTGLKRQERDAFTGQQAENERRYREDRSVLTRAFNAEQAMVNDIPKWDADKEKKKYETNPIESFGSFASVFAMVASAFTRDPMTNALNASAAAMQAKRDNNEFEYQRAFTAWKENTDLAVKRFNMQHAALGDAFKIMDHDVARGNAKLVETMTKFGMDKELLLYQNGMIPEIQQKRDSDLKAIEGVLRASEQIRRIDLEERRTKDQERRTQLTEQRDLLRAEIERQKIVVGAEKDEAKRVFEQQKLDALNQRFLKSFEQKAEQFEVTSDQRQQAIDERVRADKARESGSTASTRNKQESAEIERRKKELMEQGKSEGDAYTQAVKESDARTHGMTGNRRDQLEVQISQYDQGIRTGNEALKFLGEKPGMAGFGGKVMRPGETLANFFGASNSTAYNQFAERVYETRLRAGNLLTQSTGSTNLPKLKAAYDLLEKIVPGVQAGVSAQATRDSIKHLLGEFEAFRKNTQERLGREPSSGSATVPSEKPAEDKKWWLDAPLDK